MIGYFLVGFLSGIVSGMGIGGGAILIPALTMLFGLSQVQAQGVNLVYFLPTAATALFFHFKEKNVSVKGSKLLILFGLLGASVGSFAALFVDGSLLKKGFGILLICIGIKNFFYT